MFVANPSGGRDDVAVRDWLVGGAVIGGVALALTLASFRRSAGVIFGLVAALTKATVDRFDDGFLAVVWDWHAYALIVASVIGFALLQASLQTGALAPAIATSMVFETVVGVAVGISLLEEDLHEAAWGMAVSAVALAVIVVGLVTLARSQGAAEAPEALEPSVEAAPV